MYLFGVAQASRSNSRLRFVRVDVELGSWFYEASQPQRIISGLSGTCNECARTEM